MKKFNIILLLMLCVHLTASAQLFNFSLRTNNQQLIDVALKGVFVKIDQSYELCDTLTNEYFGRNGKNYFNILSFIGVVTETGLCYPTIAETPWKIDPDFKGYDDHYLPMNTHASLSMINSNYDSIPNIKALTGKPLSDKGLSLHYSTVLGKKGLQPDTVSGKKDGWLIWLSSKSLKDTDSIRIISIHKEIEVPADGSSMKTATPKIQDTALGGIYITPRQTAPGQITFILTGFLLKDRDDWNLVFPFINPQQKVNILTPIENNIPRKRLNQLKRKQR